MPVVNHSSYNSPMWLRNGHLQTIWPVLFRNPPLPSLWRERLDTPDGDFIDIDHIPACAGIRSGRVAILSHGLEGNSTRRYMLGMAEALNRRGWDVVARNFRGCSGEMNHTLQLYHGVETNDLHLVVQYCISLGCRSIVPLWGSAWAAIKRSSISRSATGYPLLSKTASPFPSRATWKARRKSFRCPPGCMAYFLRTLCGGKVEEKTSISWLDRIRTFSEFDDRYAAPLHGFDSARYYCGKALPAFSGAY